MAQPTLNPAPRKRTRKGTATTVGVGSTKRPKVVSRSAAGALYPDEMKRRQKNGGIVDLHQAHEWRRQALAHFKSTRAAGEEDLDFVDGDQWEDDAKQEHADKDKPTLVYNRVAVAVHVTSALERSNRTQIIALPTKSSSVEMAEAVTQITKYVCNQNDVDELLSEAYEWALSYGIGWLRVKRSDLLMREQIEIVVPDPRRVLLDPWSRMANLKDARYVLEESWVALEEAQRLYPDFAQQLADLATYVDAKNSSYDLLQDESRVGPEAINAEIVLPMEAWDDEHGLETVDMTRGMVRIWELFYRVIEDASVLIWDDGHQEEVDPENPSDVAKTHAALLQGGVKLVGGPVAHYRRKVFCGPIEITDDPVDQSYQELPYVPVWCYRDKRGRPISLVRWLKDPQREINYRLSALLGTLGTRRVLFEDGAFDDEDDAREELAAPDGFVRINRDMLGKIHIERDTDVAPINLHLLQMGGDFIDSISGANQELRGQPTNAASGVAMQERKQQGALQLMPLQDRLRVSKRMLGERIISEFRALYPEEKEIRISDPSQPGGYSFLRFNLTDPDKMLPLQQQLAAKKIVLKLAGSLDDARFDMTVEDAPASPTERARQLQELMQLIPQIAPQDPATGIRAFIMALQNSDLQQKDQLMDGLQQRLQAIENPEPQGPMEKIVDQIQIPIQYLPWDSLAQLLAHLKIPTSIGPGAPGSPTHLTPDPMFQAHAAHVQQTLGPQAQMPPGGPGGAPQPAPAPAA